jgi:hypothetical protein
MKVRELFAGYRVTLSPDGGEWRATLADEDGIDRLSTIHGELPDALDAAHEWLMMLVDDTELSDHAVAAIHTLADRVRELLARRAIGEPVLEASGLDAIADREELRRWFEREMGR